MKVVVQGTVVEGTPAEMQSFLLQVSQRDLSKIDGQLMKQKEVVHPLRRRRRQRFVKVVRDRHDWSAEEKDFLKACIAEGYDRDATIERVVRRTGRSHDSVMVKWYALKRHGGVPGETVVAMPPESPKVPSRPAGIEQYEVLFPELPVADRKVAFQVFRHAAVTRNTLNFANDAYPLGIESVEQWNVFCEDVLVKSAGIAKSIGFVPRLTRVGRSATISFDEVAAT